jgi:alpha-L-rhamnosidase
VAGKRVDTARLYVAGGGWPRLTLNGEAVSDDLFLSGHTAMDRSVLYTTVDVTDLLEAGGKNALAASWVGAGTA